MLAYADHMLAAYPNIPGNALQIPGMCFQPKKMRATAGKTSPSLLHDRDSQERLILRKEGLRQPGRTHQPYNMSDNSRTANFVKKMLATVGNPSSG